MHWTCPMSHEFIHALFIFIDYYYVCTVVNKYTGMLICTLLFLQVLWPALCNRKQTPNSRKPGNFPHERHWSFNLGLITGTCITWCHLLYWPMRGQLGRDDDTIFNSVNIRSDLFALNEIINLSYILFFQIRVNFKWRNAFDKESLFGGKQILGECRPVYKSLRSEQ